MHLPALASVAIAAITHHLPCHQTPTPSSLSASIPSTAPPSLLTGDLSQTDVEFAAAPSPTSSYEELELREIVNGAATTQPATQYPTLSTDWVETSLPAGGVTWVPVIYTQTFPTAYEAWPTPASGDIGLGTISGTVGVVRTSTPKWSGASRRQIEIGVVGATLFSVLSFVL